MRLRSSPKAVREVGKRAILFDTVEALVGRAVAQGAKCLVVRTNLYIVEGLVIEICW